MPNTSDPKLASLPKVVLECLKTQLQNEKDKTKKTASFEDSEKFEMEGDKESKNILLPDKKEEKIFEENDIQLNDRLKQGSCNIYANIVICEKLIVNQLENPSHEKSSKQVLGSEPKMTDLKATKLEKNLDEHHTKTIEDEPVIQLIPSIKCESPDIRTVKKSRLRNKNVIDIEKEWQGKNIISSVKLDDETGPFTTSNITPKHLVADLKSEVNKTQSEDYNINDIEKTVKLKSEGVPLTSTCNITQDKADCKNLVPIVGKKQVEDHKINAIEKKFEDKNTSPIVKVKCERLPSTSDSNITKNNADCANVVPIDGKTQVEDQKLTAIKKILRDKLLQKLEDDNIIPPLKLKVEKDLPTSRSINDTYLRSKKIKIEDHSLLESGSETKVQDKNIIDGAKKTQGKNNFTIEESKAEIELATSRNVAENNVDNTNYENSNKECSTLKNATGSNSDAIIKVKDPSALGIKKTQSLVFNKSLILYHQNQIKPTLGNESKIADILRIYPLFFTPEVLDDVKGLIEIINKSSKECSLGHDTEPYDGQTYISKIDSYSVDFIKKFSRVLGLDQVVLNVDLLKKVIPILYLQMDIAFKKLRREEDFNFRTVMKKLFETNRFVCIHDVILEMGHEEFKQVMTTLYRWLSEIFVECEFLDPVEEDQISIISCSSPIIIDEMEVENEHESEKSIDIMACSPEPTSESDLDYLHCPECRKCLPLCHFCHELLACPCLLEVNLVAGEGSPLNLCREHGPCGDSWTEWDQEWDNEDEDENMPLDPVCWHGPCNNRAELLCVCRIRAYCSNACQIEDWHEDHHRNCRRETEPYCYRTDLDLPQDMDVT